MSYGLSWRWIVGLSVMGCAPAASSAPAEPSRADPGAASAQEPNAGAGPAPSYEPNASAGAMAGEPEHEHERHHAHAEPAVAPDGAESAAREELSAYERAKPVFEAYCSKCHTRAGRGSSKAALAHFDMSAYPFGGHHANELAQTIREVLGLSSAKATMPRDAPGAVQGEDLQRVAAWANALERARATAKTHGPDAHGADHEH